MRTITLILDELHVNGPKSIKQMSESLGISFEVIRVAIVEHRTDPRPTERRRIRVCDFVMSASPRGKRSKIFELSGKPDAVMTPWQPRTIHDRRGDEWSARIAATDEALQSLRPLIASMPGNPFAVSIAQGRLV